MGETARRDEKRECPEDETEVQVAPFRHENGQRHRNGEIGQGDYRIRQHVQPDQLRFPQQANAMRGQR